MSQDVSAEEFAGQYASEGILDQLWFVVSVAFNLLLLGAAVALDYFGYGEEAGILGVIVAFVLAFSVVVYAFIWWSKRY